MIALGQDLGQHVTTRGFSKPRLLWYLPGTRSMTSARMEQTDQVSGSRRRRIRFPEAAVRLFWWDGRKELVCRLNIWRMELFKYMKVCQAAVAHVTRCRHHIVATRHLQAHLCTSLTAPYQMDSLRNAKRRASARSPGSRRDLCQT